MRSAAGATPDTNGHTVNFDHFGRRKQTHADISER
jgi:hypothetical protein